MNKKLSLVVVALALGACASDGIPRDKSIADSDTVCVGDLKGRTDTKLRYGEDDIRMKWKSKVGEDTEFRIKLRPRKKFRDKTVEIIGVSGTLPGGASTPFGWLNEQGKAGDFTNGIMVLCVPENLPEGTEFKFDVRIQDIGTMDPRVAVTW